MPTPVNVICMKWGKLYGPEYVNYLRAGVRRHLKRPFRFVCFTDDAQGLRDVQVLPLPELGLPQGQGDQRWSRQVWRGRRWPRRPSSWSASSGGRCTAPNT